MARMRLQKFLSHAGICSRRQGEAYIKAGRVTVNDVPVTELGASVDPSVDRVKFDGRTVQLSERLVYVALNKPRGYVSSCSQPDEKLIIDIVDIPERIYPVGRLDKDSTGLILLTNDGRIHHRLSHPSFDHEKEYIVSVERPISDGALRKMARGMPMMGTKTRPALIRKKSPRQFRITLLEGKNRQIRRMVRKVGHRVVELKRIRVANIRLGNIAEGRWRYLSETEKQVLLKSLNVVTTTPRGPGQTAISGPPAEPAPE